MIGGSTNRTEFEIYRDGVDDTDESKKRGSIVHNFLKIPLFSIIAIVFSSLKSCDCKLIFVGQ
jgi:hypothetical protein